MALKDITYIQNLLKVLNVLVFIAQNCISPFFPLFLKYLGLSLLEMSLIRAFQVIIATVITTTCVYIMKLKNCCIWKAHIVCLSLLASSGACATLAVYFQSGTKISLMQCESFINKESTFEWLNAHTDKTLNKTVYSDPTVVFEVNKSVTVTVIPTKKLHFNEGTIPENSMTSTKHIPVPYINLDLESQPPKVINHAESNVKHSSTKNGENSVKNEHTTTIEDLPSTQPYKIWSDFPQLNKLFTTPTTASHTTEVASETENLDYIFLSVNEPPKMKTPPQNSYNNNRNPVSQRHRQEGDYDWDLDVETTTKLLHKHKNKKVVDWPRFVINNQHKYVSARPTLKLPDKATLNFNVQGKKDFPEYKRRHHVPYDSNKARETQDNWESAVNAGAEDQISYATSPTTVGLKITMTTSSNFADNRFKKIMDYWNHHKPQTDNDDKSNHKNHIQNTYFENSNNKKETEPNYHIQQYPRFTYKNLGSERKRYARSDTENFQNTKQEIKRQIFREDSLKSGKDVTVGPRSGTYHQQNEDGNYKSFTSRLYSGSRTSEPPGSTRRPSETTRGRPAQYDIDAVPVSAHPWYDDVKEVFIVAAVLAAAYELCTSVALPSVQELWRQMWGRPLQTRSPLQLGTWSVCVTFVLLGAASLPCRFQGSVHCGAAAVVFALALLPALVALPPVARRARLDKATPEVESDVAEDEQLVYVQSVSKLLSGFLTACSCEFMLWHMASLGGFPLDYEALYCGYVSLSALAEGAVRSCRGERQGGGGRMLGHALLGAHFLLASVLGRAWATLAVAPLGGASSALLRPSHSTGWSLGYGAGCLAGGVLASFRSTALLFSVCGVASCVWCLLSIVCCGVLKCRRNHSYTHLLSAPEDYEERDDTDSPVECEDWLERALLEEERNNK